MTRAKPRPGPPRNSVLNSPLRATASSTSSTPNRWNSLELRRELEKANRGAEAGVARRPALDAGRPALSARERLAETLPFEAIDAALSATPPVTDWPKAG